MGFCRFKGYSQVIEGPSYLYQHSSGFIFRYRVPKDLQEIVGKTEFRYSLNTDKYGRTVGIVTANGLNFNEALIKSGCTWVYTRYCRADFCYVTGNAK